MKYLDKRMLLIAWANCCALALEPCGTPGNIRAVPKLPVARKTQLAAFYRGAKQSS